jgi:hypothetical protein
MTKARDIADFKFENIVDTGTEGTKVATGTSAQRGSTAGQLRFNSTTGLAEYYTGTDFKAIDVPPAISSVGNTNITQTQIDGGYDLSITGTNFSSGATIKFIGNDGTTYTSPTVTVNSSTSITARVNTTLDVTKEPFDVVIVSASGLSSEKSDAFNVNAKPAFVNASGSLGTIYKDATISGSTLNASATDAEGDTITYSYTGSLPSGLTLNTSTGLIIGTENAGTTPASGGDTYSFTVSASDGSNSNSRSFSILRKARDGLTEAGALQYGSEVITALGGSFTAGRYWLTGKTSSGLSAQQVYVDADGYMLFYRHAGTGGSYNSTYQIRGNEMGEGAVGTLYSPTQGLTDTGSSTTDGQRGVARLSTQFVRALGGESASGNVYRYTVGSNTDYITDVQLWYTYDGSSDGYGFTSGMSAGDSYAGRRTYTGLSSNNLRPLGSYTGIGGTWGDSGVIPFYHEYDASGYSGGYSGISWHEATTLWVRQY